MRTTTTIKMDIKPKKTILFVLLSLPFFCLAQDEGQSPAAKPQKIFIGFNVSTDLSYRSLHTKETDYWVPQLIESRNTSESPKIGNTVGVNFEFVLRKHLSLTTGLQYSNKGYKSGWFPLVFESNIDSIAGRVKVSNNYHFLDIPLGLNLKFGKKKIQFFASTGLILNVLLQARNKVIIEYPGMTEVGRSKITTDWNTFNCSAFASIGSEFTFRNNSFLRIEPIFRYGIFSIIDAPLKGRLFNAGLNISYYLPIQKTKG